MRRLVIACLGILILQGCDLFDKDEDIPGFLYVEAADLQTDPFVEGAPTQAITDVHVFADGTFAGAFEMPATIPIYGDGTVHLTLAPGIKNNGIASTRIIYPFYSKYVTDIALIPGGTVPIDNDSVVNYTYFKGPDGTSDILQFHVEDFEGQGNVWVPTGTDTTGVINCSDSICVRSGNAGGRAVLTDDNPILDVLSTADSWDMSDIPAGAYVYLEIDFKGTIPLEIGVQASGQFDQRIFALGLNPTGDWTKVYVDLTDEINGQPNADQFRIYLYAAKPAESPEATVWLDNIKVIYPK